MTSISKLKKTLKPALIAMVQELEKNNDKATEDLAKAVKQRDSLEKVNEDLREKNQTLANDLLLESQTVKKIRSEIKDLQEKYNAISKLAEAKKQEDTLVPRKNWVQRLLNL